MNISNIINYRFNPTYSKKNYNQTFTAHPDFYKLAKNYDLTASSYFRRGETYGSPSTEFADIVKTFLNIFKQETDKPRKMLIVGVADSQEPFSYLAVLKHIFNNTPINKQLQLHCVDLQSKPRKNKLFKDSFLDYFYPRYAASSFIYDENHYGKFDSLHYRVDDEIFNYLYKVYNSKNSKWETRIQDIINDYPNEHFDIISINNTLPYFLKIDKNGIDTAKKLVEILKPNGVIITDTHWDAYYGFESLYPGIFRKK